MSLETEDQTETRKLSKHERQKIRAEIAQQFIEHARETPEGQAFFLDVQRTTAAKSLTPRQKRILNYSTQRMSSATIAATLGVSVAAIKNQQQQMLASFGFTRWADFRRYAIAENLVKRAGATTARR